MGAERNNMFMSETAAVDDLAAAGAGTPKDVSRLSPTSRDSVEHRRTASLGLLDYLTLASHGRRSAERRWHISNGIVGAQDLARKRMAIYWLRP